MKDLSISLLFDKVDVVASAPSTYEELDSLLGETGGTLDVAIGYLTPRNLIPRIYGAVSKTLVELGHVREQAKDGDVPKTTKKADGTLVPVLESPLQHINRIHEAGDDQLKADINALLVSSAKSLPFYVEGERSGGGGKLAQATIDAANAMIADGTAEANAGVIESMVPGYKLNRDESGALTAESLARGIQRLEKHLQEEAKNKTKALFAGAKS